jgi:Peptidase A4 family
VIIETKLTSSGRATTSYFPWYEWYPLPLTVISNFPVAPGNVIYVSLTEDSPSVATLLFENLSQGVGVQGNIGSPTPSANLQGISVEWIVEDPSNGSSLVPFLGFGTVVFTNCIAGTSTGASVNLADSTLLSLVTVSGSTITSVLTNEALLSDTSVEVVYAGP